MILLPGRHLLSHPHGELHSHCCTVNSPVCCVDLRGVLSCPLCLETESLGSTALLSLVSGHQELGPCEYVCVCVMQRINSTLCSLFCSLSIVKKCKCTEMNQGCEESS